MNSASAFSGGGVLTGGGTDLKQRLSKALLEVSGGLASVRSGALVQVSAQRKPKRSASY